MIYLRVGNKIKKIKKFPENCVEAGKSNVLKSGPTFFAYFLGKRKSLKNSKEGKQ